MDQQSYGTSTVDNYGAFHQNQTFSMLSSGSDLGNVDDIIMSMEEADRYYRVLEEEQGGVCCSALPPINAVSTEEQTESNVTDGFTDEE